MNSLMDYQYNRIRELEKMQEKILEQRDALRATIDSLLKDNHAYADRIFELENAASKSADWLKKKQTRVVELEAELAAANRQIAVLRGECGR